MKSFIGILHFAADAEGFFKPKPMFVIGSVILVLVLLLVIGYLFQQNQNYESVNRRLIVVNDSLTSANIELSNQLHANDSFKKKVLPGVNK